MILLPGTLVLAVLCFCPIPTKILNPHRRPQFVLWTPFMLLSGDRHICKQLTDLKGRLAFLLSRDVCCVLWKYSCFFLRGQKISKRCYQAEDDASGDLDWWNNMNKGTNPYYLRESSFVFDVYNWIFSLCRDNLLPKLYTLFNVPKDDCQTLIMISSHYISIYLQIILE